MSGENGWLIELESEDANALIKRCEKSGWKIFNIGSDIDSVENFFVAIQRVMPLNPPLGIIQKWDALADSLWSGLEALSDEKILVIWPNSQTLREKDADGFGDAIEVFENLCELLADQSVTVGPTKRLSFLLPVKNQTGLLISVEPQLHNL